MTTYRHATNLRTPFDPVDLNLLSLLEDYRIGLPQEAKGKDTKPVPQAELRKRGIVGLYTTRAALMHDGVMKLTGWTEPDKELGEVWQPIIAPTLFDEVQDMNKVLAKADSHV